MYDIQNYYEDKVGYYVPGMYQARESAFKLGVCIPTGVHFH